MSVFFFFLSDLRRFRRNRRHEKRSRIFTFSPAREHDDLQKKTVHDEILK